MYMESVRWNHQSAVGRSIVYSLASIEKLGLVVLRRQWQEEQKFKVIPGYLLSQSRLQEILCQQTNKN